MPATIDELLAQVKGLAQQQQTLTEEVTVLRNPDMGGARPRPALDMLGQHANEVKNQKWGVPSLGYLAHCLVKAGQRPPREYDGLKAYFKEVDAWTKTLPSGLNETVGADGGVLVPPAFASQLLMRVYGNDLLSRTTMFPMTSNVLSIPAVDESSRASGSRYGGVTHYWAGEANQLTASKPQFAEVDLRPNDLTVFVRATNNLINDAPAAQMFLNTVAIAELQYGVGNAIVRGDGVKKPLGLLGTGSGRVTQAVESGQTTVDPIMPANLTKMYARLHASCVPTAVWLMNQSLYADLMLMTVGSGSSNIPVMLPNQSLSGAPYGSILGRPIIPVEFASAKNTEGDIILVDLSQYLTGQIGGTEIASSIHLYFDYRETVFRFVIRIDGRPWWKTALTPASGDDTQSYCVTLATRS